MRCSKNFKEDICMDLTITISLKMNSLSYTLPKLSNNCHFIKNELPLIYFIKTFFNRLKGKREHRNNLENVSSTHSPCELLQTNESLTKVN